MLKFIFIFLLNSVRCTPFYLEAPTVLAQHSSLASPSHLFAASLLALLYLTLYSHSRVLGASLCTLSSILYTCLYNLLRESPLVPGRCNLLLYSPSLLVTSFCTIPWPCVPFPALSPSSVVRYPGVGT
eukprot:sb/3475388/